MVTLRQPYGLAWLPGVPEVEQLLSSPDTVPDAVKEENVKYAHSLVSTINPAVLPDGSNINDAPAPKTDPSFLQLGLLDMQDYEEDLAELVATCQHHTRCSAAYS